MKLKLKSFHAALCAVCLSPLTAQAVSLPIIADSYIAATNAGSAVAVNINATQKGLLNFDLSSLPNGTTSSDIAKATLVVYVKTLPTSGELQVAPVTSAWTENTVTTLNAPALGTPLSTSAPVTNGNTYFAIDVTSAVQNWVTVPANNFGLALEPAIATPTTSLTIDSKEAIQTSHPAYIEVVLKGPAGPRGPVGATGPQGIAGQATSTVCIETIAYGPTAGPGAVASARAYPPSGYTITGGGCETSHPTISLYMNAQDVSTNSWVCSAFDTVRGAYNVAAHVNACKFQ